MAKPRITGPDLILLAADAAAERGVPYASLWLQAVQNAIIGQSLLLAEVVATRPLEPHEHTPVTTIGTAAHLAAQKKDVQSLVEVAHWGSALIARWPLIVALSPGGNPDFDLKATGHALPLAPAAWYPDPTEHELRYWNGQRWTEHVSDRGTMSTSPL
jgi:hypothetical protein